VVANLEAPSKDATIEPKGPATGVGHCVAIAIKDGHGATRLLLPGIRARLMAALGDFVYVGIPDRDFLVAWSRDYSYYEQFIEQIAQDFQRRPYPVTGALFVVTPAGVRPATAAETQRYGSSLPPTRRSPGSRGRRRWRARPDARRCARRSWT
jgi:hypothetical protein